MILEMCDVLEINGYLYSYGFSESEIAKINFALRDLLADKLQYEGKNESIPTINPSKDESSCVIQHRKICEELNQLYKAKNTDYGDSCHQTYIEEGMATFRVRLSDKLNRFKILTSRKSIQKVNDESVRDTLMDLINYSIMAIMEIDNGRIE